MTVFSVAITLASSRKISAPARPGRAHLEAIVDLDLGPELGERMDVRVEPAAADHVAARRRHARPPEPCEQRAREEERGANAAGELWVDLGARDLGRVDANLVLARPLGPRRRALRAAPPSSRRPGSAGRSKG